MGNDRRQRRLSEDWADLAEKDVAPVGEGRSAEIAKRDETRTRKRFAYEDRRLMRRFTITCATGNTPRQLRRVCAHAGYTDAQGLGVITSSVVEALVLAGMEAYEQGDLELPEKRINDRKERRVHVTCQSDETPDQLRRLCGALGYLNAQGEPMINSRVVEELIQAGIEAYDRGAVQVVPQDGQADE